MSELKSPYDDNATISLLHNVTTDQTVKTSESSPNINARQHL